MNSETQERILDARMYTLIQTLCNETPWNRNNAVNHGSRRIRVGDTLLAYAFLAQRASKREIEYHKSDYVRMFKKVIGALQPVDGEMAAGSSAARELTPSIIAITDWFIQQDRGDNVHYRTRLNELTEKIQEKKLPVPTEKQEEWSKKLAPKRPRSRNIRPLLEPAEVCQIYLNRTANHLPND